MDYGPRTRRKLATGTPVVALPLLRRGHDVHAIGLSAAAPGAYAEQLVVEESLMLAVPNGLSPDVAALTEPMAIAWHAVRRVVDPSLESPYARSEERGHLTTVPAKVKLGLETMDKLSRVPVPWHYLWRAAETLGARPKHPVIFECVGLPGILDDVIAAAPLYSRVVVVGVCMTPDTIRPAMAINKEIELRFVVGYNPLEFRDTLQMLADGKVDAGVTVTGTVGLAGVERAFDALATAETHAKILVDPKSPAAEPAASGPLESQ